MTTTRENKGDQTLAGNKSRFMHDAETMQIKLDTVSPSFCLAKWKQVSLHLTTGMTNSCYHPPLHRIPIESLKTNPQSLHNTPEKKQQRKMMLQGTRPQECQYCWTIEDQGNLSDRHYRSGEPWASKDFESIAQAPWHQDVVPSYVEVNFNHNCNLKCSYCSPQYSTAWEDESRRHGAWPTRVPHNAPEYFQNERRPIPHRDPNPYIDAFWQWWPTLYPELQHFRMTGGEPLMDKNTYRVFDYVLANPKPDLHLNVTSNFSVDQKLWVKYLSAVKQICQGDNVEHFMQYVSVDAWGTRAEYIRNGLDFDLLWQRVEQFLVEVPYRSSLTFIITMNNLSLTSLQNLLEGILDLRRRHSHTYQRVWFDTPLLRQPAWQSMQILPMSYIGLLERCRDYMISHVETDANRFKGFKDYEIQRISRDIDWTREGWCQTHEAARGDFYRFFSEHDRRRGTDFVKTFPEMRAWWATCEQAARDT